jgi:hypothetical protein
MTGAIHSRQRKFAVALVAAVVGLTGLHVPSTGAAPTATAPHPVVQAAILPEATRLTREHRYAAVRRIGARLLGRLRTRTASTVLRGLGIRPRLPVRECYARGPPG